VDELLELVHIEHLAERYPSQLSAASASGWPGPALAIEPTVLLLDEPFGASTPRCARSCARGCATSMSRSRHTLLVTHDQDEAMEVADQLAVINEGAWSRSGHRRPL